MPEDQNECVCPIAGSVAKQIISRANLGKEKYGVTCERGDLTLVEWLTHLQQELMDAAVYIEKIKTEINDNTNNNQTER